MGGTRQANGCHAPSEWVSRAKRMGVTRQANGCHAPSEWVTRQANGWRTAVIRDERSSDPERVPEWGTVTANHTTAVPSTRLSATSIADSDSDGQASCGRTLRRFHLAWSLVYAARRIRGASSRPRCSWKASKPRQPNGILNVGALGLGAVIDSGRT